MSESEKESQNPEEFKTAVLIPCHKRPEYTDMCLKAVLDSKEDYSNTLFYLVDDGSKDRTSDILNAYANELEERGAECRVFVKTECGGLRNAIIDFFEFILEHEEYKYITKIDNDCLVPDSWLTDLTNILTNAQADIISPNTSETNAAYKYGLMNKRQGPFIPSKIVGGLWFMTSSMLDDIFFERFSSKGIRCAFHLINQIIVEKDPKVGWTDAVKYEDVGFWAGTHPKHIKSFKHAMYSVNAGRRIAWRPVDDNVQV